MNFQNNAAYTVKKANADATKNVLLLKKPQFLPYYYKT